jgi:putative DNA primase/helicase
LRNVGDEHEPRAFPTFAAVAIATIGTLPGTLIDRSVILDLKRRLPNEPITPFRLDRTDDLDQLVRQIARWVKDHIIGCDPKMPPGIINRAADNWRPLCAIADAVGGEWPERLRKAILAANPESAEGGLSIELLLGDVRDIFDKLGRNRISSEDLITNLVEITPRPWAEYGRSGKPLTPNKLASLLKPLAITPHLLRSGDDVFRGYERSQFDEAFARYLSEKGASNRHTATNADGMGTSGIFQTVTGDDDVTVRASQKTRNDRLCDGVTVRHATFHCPEDDLSIPKFLRRTVESLP